MSVPRYTSSEFPAYRYVPGHMPHPTRDRDGHSFGKAHDPLPEFRAEDWRQCEPYLYGIDLFNHGYWWEAHEALENCWVAAGRDTPLGLFLQGLIQLAVACLKGHQGFHDVAARMAADGLAKFPHNEQQLLGLDLTELRNEVADYFAGRKTSPIILTLK